MLSRVELAPSLVSFYDINTFGLEALFCGLLMCSYAKLKFFNVSFCLLISVLS